MIIPNAWTGLWHDGDVWLWLDVPVYYNNRKLPDNMVRYGLLTTEGGGHWRYVTRDEWIDISHGIYQTQKGPDCQLLLRCKES